MEWVYRKGVDGYEQMTNLPGSLRDELTAALPLFASTILQQQKSRDGTVKLLLGWADGASSECVLIPQGSRRTACISTQVGCAVGCVFCASGLGGLQRQLSVGEIVEQAMRICRLCGADDRLSNVVFMGLGEPLANYDATVAALRTFTAEWGMGIGARRMTVSTVGLPKAMVRLADEGLQVTLAISLHAPDDALRRRIIPWAKSVSIDALIEAGRMYFQKTGREITLEYILLGGLNDQPNHARQLAEVAARMRSNVNLIRYNPVQGLPFLSPALEQVRRFQDILQDRGVNVHVRRSRGLDIEAACGQLRRRQAQGGRIDNDEKTVRMR